MSRKSWFMIVSVFLFSAIPTLGQSPEASPVSCIQDNSFLLEEAYNQENGVIQHISFFTRDRDTRDWIYTFTEEIPAGGLKHQLSLTQPLLRIEGESGPGDVAINYRYQLTGDGTKTLAVAPRVSVVLPSGSADRGRGTGAVGLQFNLPASYVLSPRIAAHTNAGVAWTGSSENPAGDEADTWTYSAGQSFIYALSNRVHLMLEGSFARTQSVAGPGATTAGNSMLIGPAIRWAHNFPGGLQIVPGIGVPFGVGPSAGERSVLLYVSLEHSVGARSRR